VGVEFGDSPAVIGRDVEVPVWLYNFSTAARVGKVSCTVFAVPVDSQDDPGVAVYSFSLAAPDADADGVGAAQADVRFTLPANLSDGCYVLRVEADPAGDDANPADNIALSGLFWLDAHWSGGSTAKGELETPIMQEIECILAHPLSARHVLLIDDARCFVGQNDYPSLETLRKRILAAHADWLFEVQNDIIRTHARSTGN